MFEEYDVFKRERLTLHVVITLLSPLSHIGNVSGNVSNLKTLKVLDLEGNVRECFVYSGNALRNGILRRKGIASVLSDLGLQVGADVHHTLFAGGRIDSGTANDMDLDRRVRQLMPWLSVLGTAKPMGVFGAKDSQMIPGRINVGSGYLICYESARYVFQQFPGAIPYECLPGMTALQASWKKLNKNPFCFPSAEDIEEWENSKRVHVPYLRKTLRVWTEYLVLDQIVRKDSVKDSCLQEFLVDRTLLAGEGTPKAKKSDQMIAGDRMISAGSRLYSRWDIHATTVEIGWVVNALLEFSKSPYLGGKNSRGNGLVSLQIFYEKEKEQGQFLELGAGVDAISPVAESFHGSYQGYINAYRQFLAEVKESKELRRLLDA